MSTFQQEIRDRVIDYYNNVTKDTAEIAKLVPTSRRNVQIF